VNMSVLTKSYQGFFFIIVGMFFFFLNIDKIINKIAKQYILYIL